MSILPLLSTTLGGSSTVLHGMSYENRVSREEGEEGEEGGGRRAAIKRCEGGWVYFKGGVRVREGGGGKRCEGWYTVLRGLASGAWAVMGRYWGGRIARS